MSNRPDLTDAPLSVKMLYPGDYWDQDRDAERQKEYEKANTELSGARVCGIVDSDADGLGCEVLLREAFPDTDVGVVQAGHRKDVDMSEAVAMAAEQSAPDARVIVADLCPDASEVDELVFSLGAFEDAVVLDHHDWTAEMRNAVESEATLVHDAARCATQLVRDYFFESPPAYLDEFADVTADHDLWIKEDDRSDDLADFQFWGDSDTYVDSAREHGAAITSNPEVQEFLAENRREKQERIRLAIEGAESPSPRGDWAAVQTGADWVDVEFDTVTVPIEREWYEENIDDTPDETLLIESGNRVEMSIDGPLSVAFLYGEMYASGAGQAAQEAGADVAVIVPPYNKLSIRTRDETPLGASIAQELGGGGHPPAAGAKPDLVGSRNEVSYSDHWESKGAVVKQRVLTAIESVIDADTPTPTP